MRLPEIPLQIPPGILKKYEIRIFGAFFWYFRGIFSIRCRRGNLYVGLVFLAYFGVCGVFCSVAGSWVVNKRGVVAKWPVIFRKVLGLDIVFGGGGQQIALDDQT